MQQLFFKFFRLSFCIFLSVSLSISLSVEALDGASVRNGLDTGTFRTAKNFSYGEEELHIERFDFSKKYPELQDIEIDAKRNKRVFLDCSGQFPLLKTISYEGTFGVLNGTFTGNYESLDYVSICCTSCKINLTFDGTWRKNAYVNICNRSEAICLRLPKTIGVIIQTHTSFGGKVNISPEYFQTKKGLRNKSFRNELAGSVPTITFDIQTGDGGSITVL
ncbi:hypothetical protein [Chlamydiifrater phoenicopteri]|uniref:hypothetical protein n=1 Tax=Chlamydiifrater phoenicopteri TaxID=2681469 RepID=UPI001BCD55B9|nr:hypothetical protein [Chlamydiifrater phoenicopteri]